MNTDRKQRSIPTEMYMALFSAVLLIMSLRINDTLYMGISGSRLIPVSVSAAMLVISTIKCIFSIIANKKTAENNAKHNYYAWGLALSLLTAYAFVLETIGYVIASLILLSALAPLFGLTNPLKILALSLGITFSSWLLFTKVFGSYLPTFTLF